MSDDNRRDWSKLLLHLIYSFLHCSFINFVKSTCRFIKNKQFWLFNENTSKRNSLLLAARKLTTSSANICVNLVRVILDKLPCVGLLQCVNDLFISCIWFAHENILLDCRVKKDRLLLYISNLSSQFSQFYIFNLLIINVYFTSSCIVESLNQLDNCALSRSWRPDDSCGLAHLKSTSEISEHFLFRPGWIEEFDTIKLYLSRELVVNSCFAVITNFDRTVNNTESKCASSFAFNDCIETWSSSRQGEKAKENTEEDWNCVTRCISSVISIIPVLFSNPVATQSESVHICCEVCELKETHGCSTDKVLLVACLSDSF